jgi:3-phosphoshikimate 1-carboxyvinyltransferase
MTETIEIRPCGPLRATIRPPGSKSITNRALVCAALAEGQSLLRGALDSDDTRVMIEGLGKLGVTVDHDPRSETVAVEGCGGRLPATSGDIWVGNSGTTVRFLTAAATLGHGVFRFDGTPRMRARPIQDLLDALRQLGAEAVSAAGTGCPPVVVHAGGLPGGRAELAGNVSSQFLSAILMAAPYARSTVQLRIRGELVSRPYVTMTLRVMEAFGIDVPWVGGPAIDIPAGQTYRGRNYAIEPDASAAGYFFSAAAIAGGSVTVAGLGRESIQGDVALCDCLRAMGCRVDAAESQLTITGGPLHGIEVDMNAISDAVPTLAVVSLFAAGPTTITHVGHIRYKETDRLRAVATELRKLGADVQELADGLQIRPGPLHGAEIETYDDHRMAMSFALAGLRIPGVAIRDPGCVAKTYPKFFEDLTRLAQP